MKTMSIAAFILSATVSLAHASQPSPSLEMGAAVKNLTEINIAPDTSILNIVAEGAGKLVVQGESLHFYALCAITDTKKDKKVISGTGDCELKTTEGALLHARFETLPGHGDQGLMTLEGGTGNLERFNVKAPIDVTVNPSKVGKMVFFAESSQ